MYRKILVPLDGSSFAEQALPWAVSIAKRADAALEVLHVYSPLPAIYGDDASVSISSLEATLRKQKEGYLEQIASRVLDVTGMRVKARFFEGDTAGTVARVASNTEVDMVVMTTHARGPFGRLWLGSVADELIRHLPMPLFLVPPREGLAELDADRFIRQVLLPLDGTALAEQMLKPALALGKLMNSDYTLLRVIRPILTFSFPLQGSELGAEAESMMSRVKAIQTDLRKEAYAYLEHVVRKCNSGALAAKIMVAEDEQPGVAILRTADETGADLIALETHGRRGLSRLLMGSVADKVVRGAKVPVLVQRPVYE
jgi:nucleotide-binding universal stress UspA family protein